MAPKPTKAEKKIAYDAKLCKLLEEYTQILVVNADNVGSNQLQNIRRGLRGDSIVLMGKNTMMKRSVRMHAESTGNDVYLSLIPLLVGNVGLIFTKGDLKEVSEEVAKYKVGAPARVGLVAPIDVVVPPGNTGLDPSQTSFFQVLNIPTKINKGTVEIITPVELIKKGDKVGSSEAALLSKLGIRPFSYGLVVLSVYDNGSVFSPEVLDLTEDDLVEKFAVGVSMVTALSLAISYPTLAAAPHMFINAYKNVLAVAVETDYSFPEADKVKEYLKDPSKFAVAAVAAPAAATGGAPAAAAKEEEKKEEPAEESDDDMGFSLTQSQPGDSAIDATDRFVRMVASAAVAGVSLTAHQRNILAGVNAGASSLSFVGSGFIVLCYLLFKELRKFSFKLVFYLALSDMLCSFFSIVGDPSKGFFCSAQGYSTHFFCVASFLWTTTIAFTLHRTVVKHKTDVEEFEAMFHLYVWGTSLAMTVIRSFGNDHRHLSAWCWTQSGLAGKAIHLLTFYMPLWGAILYNGFTYFQVIRMLNNATRMAVGMSGQPYASDARDNMRALNRWGYYPLILIGSWAFGTINRIHDFFEPNHKIFWLSFLDVGMASLMGLFNSIAYGLNSSVRRAICERVDKYWPEGLKRWLPINFKYKALTQESELVLLSTDGQR
ncbi:hypothetical protein AHAS_Ahas16G0308300 [Arachis hypogaea]